MLGTICLKVQKAFTLFLSTPPPNALLHVLMSLMTSASWGTISSLFSLWAPTFSPLKLQVSNSLKVSAHVSAAPTNKWSQQKKIFILLTDLCSSSVMSTQPSMTLGRMFNLYSSRSSLNFFSVEALSDTRNNVVPFIVLIILFLS